MTSLPIRKIGIDDRAAVTDLLVAAFDDDPWFNFVATNDAHRRQRMRRWLRRGLERKALPAGESYMTAGCEGVALWMPPGLAAGGLLDDLELRLTLLRVCGLRRLRAVLAGIRVVITAEPRAPHVELRILAVAPQSQGRGIASALVRPMLRRCDERGLDVALLCTKERNVDLYRRFGFDVAVEVHVPDGPRLWQMWRPAGA